MQSTDLRKESQLSLRLSAVADLVPHCHRLLDIGTDHALLPIDLITRRRCQVAVAADIRQGPLTIASRNIRKAGLSGKIETHLGAGLDGIDLRSDDVIAIAGMGGYEMMEILGGEPRLCQAIILQPMKSLPEIRLWLARHGYSTDEELLACEANHYYVIIRCRFSGQACEMTALQAQVGPKILQRRPAGFAGYLNRLLARLEKQKRGNPGLADVIDQIKAVYEQARRDENV